ncbi:MAG: hydantoinase B, partial [Chloroflexota bacterium]
MKALDPISFTVIWDRMVGACNELVTALLQTSFSPVVREAGDLAAALFDPRGRMLCQPITGTPGHINPLSAGVKNLLAEFPSESLEPGDVLITNDPWLTTGQLLDVTVLVPIFRGDRLVAHFACTCHMVDIGGYGPGAGAHDSFEEGILIPPMYLQRRGEPDRSLLKLLLANNRNPEHFLGDLESMVASCYVGGGKLLELMAEYGLEDIEGIGDEILARSRAAQEAAIRRLP